MFVNEKQQGKEWRAILSFFFFLSQKKKGFDGDSVCTNDVSQSSNQREKSQIPTV